MGAWSIIFYLSKYYELGGTWLLILKGKPATFLQVGRTWAYENNPT